MIDITTWHPAQQLAEVMTRIYDLGLTTPSGGNISMKDEEGNVWVTPSLIDKGNLMPADIVKICVDGSIEGKYKPTSEYPFHLGIYKARPDIRAIVHSHPCALVTFSITGGSANFRTIPSLLKTVNSIGFTSYCIPGSEDLGRVVSEGFSNGYDAIIMENHGVITTGTSLLSAFHYLENLEVLAEIQLNARRIGNIISLNKAQSLPVQEYLQDNSKDDRTKTPDEKEQVLRDELAHYIKRAYTRKLSTATSGCWSIRVDSDSFLIKAEGFEAAYGHSPDLMLFPPRGAPNVSLPSPYLQLHHAIYKSHPEINAICCVMPAHVMAFAISDARFDTRTIPESYIMLQNVPVLDFEVLYTRPQEIPRTLSKSSPCILLKNECLLVTGDSLFQVFDRAEVAEFTARSVIQSRLLGTLCPISEDAIAAIKKTYLAG